MLALIVGTFTQSIKAPVEEEYDSVSKLSGDAHPESEVKTRSHGSCPPFGAVQRFWIVALPPFEIGSHDASVLETSMGKAFCVPDAIFVFAVTVIERS